MLATFNSTRDWTAIGTLALAAVTLVAVIVTAIALRQARADIALSRRRSKKHTDPSLCLWPTRRMEFAGLRDP